MNRPTTNLLWMCLASAQDYEPALRVLAGVTRYTGVDVTHARWIGLVAATLVSAVMMFAAYRLRQILSRELHSEVT